MFSFFTILRNSLLHSVDSGPFRVTFHFEEHFVIDRGGHENIVDIGPLELGFLD